VTSLDPALVFLLGLAVLIISLELISLDRPPLFRRWAVNGILGLVSLIIPRLLLAIAPIGAAAWAAGQGFGLFNQFAAPAFLIGMTTIVLMDLAVYWQHRAFHRVDMLWRWHRLHHEDQALDISTGVRFHPVEALLSMFWKSVCVVALGAPVWAVPLFEAWLIAGSLIEHGNVKLPPAIDRFLRQFLVTPAMHRVHHSAHDDDANHNFCFAISLWDRWFRTYRATESGPRIGLA
jgi:sterol desaturase/sphingolipid hydroxylase (fatty acid hydroxylase superfamily)